MDDLDISSEIKAKYSQYSVAEWEAQKDTVRELYLRKRYEARRFDHTIEQDI